MKKILTIFICLLPLIMQAQTPTANAGANQTIYLTSTNQVTLTGTATNRSSSTWREISTDYSSGATITSPSSLTTTVTGLPQGVFYFELDVVSPTDIHSDDTVAVIVDYDAPPNTNTLVTTPNWSDVALGANLRDDTTTCYSWTSDIRSLVGTNPNAYVMEKDGELGSFVDTMRQKYYSILLDGHGCSGYGRSEIIPARHLEDWIDTSKIYVIEWKGYFPQDMSPYAITDYANVIGQIHGSDGYSPPFGIAIKNNQLYFTETFENGNGTGNAIYNPAVNLYEPIISADSLWNQTHTFKWVFKEGKNYPNQKNFIELKIDGITKYYRNTGQVGSTLMSDWIKGATMYDFVNLITDANNHTRGRKVSLTTESYKIYTVSDTTTYAPPTSAAPTVSVSDKSVTTGSTMLTATAVFASGLTGTYSWSQVNGATTTLSGQSSATLNISGLISGTYQFNCKVTQSDGQTANATATVTVTIAAPTIYAGNNQTITAPNTTLTATYTLAPGFTGSFDWVQETSDNGSICTINSPHSSTTTISNLKTGNYRFGCTLTQSDGQTAYDYVLVAVTIAAPTVNAGADQNITTSTTSITATGSTISGYTLNYLWTEISGSATIDNNTNSTINVSGLSTGTYQFEIKATQNDGQFAKDTVTVNVTLPVAAPTISMSGDQTIHITTATIFATATWAPGHTGTYLWTRISGTGSSITAPSSASTGITGLTNGVYQYQCKITQDDGQIATGTVTVTVVLPPTANAGSDITITLPTNSATLSGSATGTGLTYLWTKISGSGTQTISGNTTLTPTVSGMTTAGTYVFQLSVTDSYSQTTTDQITITVLNAITSTSQKWVHAKGKVFINK